MPCTRASAPISLNHDTEAAWPGRLLLAITGPRNETTSRYHHARPTHQTSNRLDVSEETIMKRVTTIYKLTEGACWYYLLRVCATTKEKVEEEKRTICFNHLSCVSGDIGSDVSVPHLFYICPAIVITVTLAHPPAIRSPRVYSAAVYGHAMGYMRYISSKTVAQLHVRKPPTYTPLVQCCPPPSLQPKNRYSTTTRPFQDKPTE